MSLELAKEMGIFEEIFIMEQQDGKDALLQAMTEFAETQIFLDKMQSEIGEHNLVFITGIGADKQIEIDLDDGVAVNYMKFKELLVDIKLKDSEEE